jgi:peptide/nickel transport system substrate-binding protein
MSSTGRFATIAIAAAVGLTACSGSDGRPNLHSTNAPQAKLVNGKTFVETTNSDIGSLDPFSNNAWFGNPAYPTALAYDSLVSVDAKGKVLPLLAATWDATTTTASFVLRDGITCSDGSPLLASDVAADINYAADVKNKSVLVGQYVKPGSTATADDGARTVQVRSGAEDPFLLQDVGSMPIVCKAGLKNRKLLEQGTVGTGLFKVTQVVAGTSYTLVRRTDYAWGPGDWKNNQTGLPDKIVLRVVANATTRANLLLAGDINYAVALNQRDAPRLAGLFKVEQPLPTGVFLFNEAPGHPTSDPAVRKAFVQALDLDEVGKVIGEGEGQRSRQINEYFVPNVCPGNTVDGLIPSHDVQAANTALDKAGWVAGADGIRVKDGKKLTVLMPTYGGFEPFTTAGELMTKKLKAAGIELKSRPLGGPAYGQAQSTDAFDLLVQSWSFPNPAQMVASYTGKPPSQGGNNVGDVHNPQYEALTSQAAAKPGTDGCSLWNQAESELIKRLDVVPFWSTPSIQYGKGAIFSLAQFTWSIRMTA